MCSPGYLQNKTEKGRHKLIPRARAVLITINWCLCNQIYLANGTNTKSILTFQAMNYMKNFVVFQFLDTEIRIKGL